MEQTSIDRLYQDFQALSTHLNADGQVSFSSLVDDNFRKALLLASASYFEHRICGTIVEFMHEISAQNTLLVEFLRNKAISRQYHTFFAWDSGNANTFFGLFGAAFREYMKAEIKQDTNIDAAIKAFLEIGAERNRLVHQDFGSYSLEKTADEIYALYRAALAFVEVLPEKLRSCT